MARVYNLARMTTATTGTGTITLGSAVAGFLTFAAAGIADGETVGYAVQDGASSEIGRGVYTASGTTLTRSVLASTNAGSAINLSGQAQVAITPAAEDLLPRVNAQTGTTYTVVSLDLGKVVTFTNAAPVAVTLPQAINAFGAGYFTDLSNVGGTPVTITPTTSTIAGRTTYTLYPGESIRVTSNGTNWLVTAQGRASGQNLIINGDFQVNQRAFAGGSLSTGVYGYDRWKANGSSSMTLSGYSLTLTSGTAEQVIELAAWGVASFASTAFTVSFDVDSGSTGSVTPSLGSTTGSAISTATVGRVSQTITTGAGDTSNISLKIANTTGTPKISRVKVEFGAVATPWVARDANFEMALCRRYYQRLQATAANQAMGQCLAFSTTGGFGIFAFLPVIMRSSGSVTSAAATKFRLTKGDGTAFTTCTSGTTTWSLTHGFVVSLTGDLTATAAGLTLGGNCWVVALDNTCFIACDSEL